MLIRDFLSDLIDSARDAFAYVLATILIGWIFTPPEWL